jgi:MFS family permease
MNQVSTTSSKLILSRKARIIVLLAAFLGLLFDGIELGLMPIASISVTRNLLGSRFTDVLAGDWFARFTASLMLGAAAGGIAFGALGDRIGRTRAMGMSILFYSLFSGAGLFVGSLEQMLVLRFQAVLQSVLQKGCPVGYRIKTIKIFSTANNKYFLRRF